MHALKTAAVRSAQSKRHTPGSQLYLQFREVQRCKRHLAGDALPRYHNGRNTWFGKKTVHDYPSKRYAGIWREFLEVLPVKGA